jgi:hypothetical protein
MNYRDTENTEKEKTEIFTNHLGLLSKLAIKNKTMYLARSCALAKTAQLQTSNDYLHRLTRIPLRMQRETIQAFNFRI